MLQSIDQPANIMVDCSHANSNKDHERQVLVAQDVAQQISDGNQSIMGIMLESNLEAGNQPLTSELRYGVSITDACIDWNTTAALLKEFAQSVKPTLTSRAVSTRRLAS